MATGTSVDTRPDRDAGVVVRLEPVLSAIVRGVVDDPAAVLSAIFVNNLLCSTFVGWLSSQRRTEEF